MLPKLYSTVRVCACAATTTMRVAAKIANATSAAVLALKLMSKIEPAICRAMVTPSSGSSGTTGYHPPFATQLNFGLRAQCAGGKGLSLMASESLAQTGQLTTKPSRTKRGAKRPLLSRSRNRFVGADTSFQELCQEISLIPSTYKEGGEAS